MTLAGPRAALTWGALAVAFWAGHRFPAAEATLAATRAAWADAEPAPSPEPWGAVGAQVYDPAGETTPAWTPPGERPAPVPGDVVFAEPFRMARAPVPRARPPTQLAAGDGWTLPPRPPPARAAAEQDWTERVAAVIDGHDGVAVRSAAFARATAAYERLKHGDRRAAAYLFDAALADDPNAPQAAAWAAARDRLERRWHGDAYYILRADGSANTVALADRQVLGGGALGATISYTQDPLAKRPLFGFARIDAATRPLGVPDGRTAQAAVGVGWRVLPWATVSVERRFKLGADTVSGWAARVAAGTSGASGRIRWDAYGEGGVAGLPGADLFAAGQARAGYRLWGPVDLGGGLWGALQHSPYGTPGRLDIGPSLRARVPGTPLVAQADWRFRLAGAAAPGSGPVATLSAGF